MKTILTSLFAIAVAGNAFAGDSVVTTRQSYQSSETACSRTIRTRNAGTEGAYYRSNLFQNAVVLINDTSDFMTFFVYSGALCGPSDINHLIRTGAHVYETVVPPHQMSFTDQRGHHYWIGSKRGKWGIDMAHNRVVPLPW